MLQQCIQNAVGHRLVAALNRDCQQAGVWVRRNGHQLPQVALLHVEILRNVAQGRAVAQQGSVGGKDRIGAVRVLVGHAGHDLVIGGNIHVRTGHPDIVGIQLVQHGVLSIFLRFLDGILGAALAFFIVGNIHRILRFG